MAAMMVALWAMARRAHVRFGLAWAAAGAVLFGLLYLGCHPFMPAYTSAPLWMQHILRFIADFMMSFGHPQSTALPAAGRFLAAMLALGAASAVSFFVVITLARRNAAREARNEYLSVGR